MEEDLTKKAEEYLNGWKRERADFLNYKKNESERMASLVDYKSRETILKILPIIDTISLAVANTPDPAWQALQKQVQEFMDREGVEEVTALGQPFDPNCMEAIEEEEGELSGVVTAELQKGYTLNGKLIRPAKVKITK